MGRRIKIVICTGFAGAQHVSYQELPEDWDSLNEEEQQATLDEFAQIELANRIECSAEVVSE